MDAHVCSATCETVLGCAGAGHSLSWSPPVARVLTAVAASHGGRVLGGRSRDPAELL